MNPLIFREYDIRGVFERDFSFEDARIIGRAFGTYIRERGGRTVLLGRDGRLSSPAVREAVIEGLVLSGTRVMDLGVCPSPVLYFGLHHLNADAGLMITASHNPPEYNGFKLCLGRETIHGSSLQDFRRLIEAGRFTSGAGSVEHIDMIKPYQDFVAGNVKLERPIRLAVDAGNATAGLAAGQIFRRLGCQVEELFFELDGHFPHHPPDPTVEANVAVLSQTVVEQGLELGLAFDGDADRLAVVDEQGRLIPGDRLLLILARQVLEETGGGKFIADVKTSHLFFKDIEARGGQAIMWRSGHSLIRSKLKEENALLAGEFSGHIFFRHRFLGHDDGMYAAARLLEIVSRRAEPISRYLDDLPAVAGTPEIRIECPEDKKFKLVELVKAELKARHQTIDLDGVRVVFPDGWGLIRASNTGPLLVLRFEAESPGRLREIRGLIEDALKKCESMI
ncbi:MAG: phosphomannomutase/phosphoglucomutase [Thermodesulfobacteriota bacterium]